jgi:O-antigen biosynthesis protein
VISVITPLHAAGNPYVVEAYRSLAAQTVREWEWIVVENAGGKLPEAVRADRRVRVVEAEVSGIGALKRVACGASRGELVVEFDCDDELDAAALGHVARASEKADFVYSDFAEFEGGPGEPRRTSGRGYPYPSRYGWSHYPVEANGTTLVAMRAPDVTAHNIRFVDWAPNHVRAWRASTYWRVGGHDPKKRVGDDHDLVVRMFLGGATFTRVPECLYFYRVHDTNTTRLANPAIRSETTATYNRHVWSLAEAWAKASGLGLVDLCGGIDSPKGYTPIDKRAGPGVLQCDLEGPWPLADSSVGVLRAYDAVEHLRDPIHTMNEAFRVLAPGGWMMIHVPASNGLGAFCDPTHRSYWNRLSLRYYADPAFMRYVPDFVGRFQISRVLEWHPTPWHKDNEMPYVEAQLFAMKDGFRAMGDVP